MTAPVPANLRIYLDVLGEDLAVEFLLSFGGAELYFARNPQARGAVTRLIGREKAMALAERSHLMSARVPTAKPWLSRFLRGRGYSVKQIARTLHVSDVSVRGWLKVMPTASGDDPQLSLF